MKYSVLHIISMLFIGVSFGQTLTATLSKENIVIGEPVELKLKISSKESLDSLQYTTQVNDFKVQNIGSKIVENTEYEINALEIFHPFKDTFYNKNGLHFWEATYSLIAWDSAMVILPGEKVTFNDSLYSFNNCALLIDNPKIDPTKEIYDIIELETELPNNPNLFYLFLAIGGLLLIGSFLFFYLKKQRKPFAEKEIALPLKTYILDQISELENSKLYISDLKEYYFRLSIIIRDLLTYKYEEKYLDKTTAEIKFLLKKQDLDTALIDTVGVLLSQADLVKFAKSKPSEIDILATTEKAKKIVHLIASTEIIISKT